MASGTRVRFSSLIYENINQNINFMSILHLKYEWKFVSFVVYILLFSYLYL